MEMVILSDIHIGRYKYGRMNQYGYDLRTADILDNIQQSFDYAEKHGIKTIHILGDFFHTKRPPHIFRRLLASKLEWALAKGIKLYLLLGNHDQGKSHAHDLVEFVELSSQIENLYVIDTPISIETEDSIFCFMPHVNIFDMNIENDKFFDYVIKSVKQLTQEAKDSKKKYKYFFGHYATDKSKAGSGFDMGMDEKCNRVLPLSIFDESVWTKVYLGDIHKPQELNSFCRHVGSIAKVDFGEEGEVKGFYYVKDDKDKFIEINDREFKMLSVDLSEDARKQMTEFCNSVQDLDLSQCIVRLRVVMKEIDKNLISFTGIEDYLKESCWNYIGKSIQEVREDKEEIKMEHNEDMNYMTLFHSYINQRKVELKEEVIKTGEKVLADVINS